MNATIELPITRNTYRFIENNRRSFDINVCTDSLTRFITIVVFGVSSCSGIGYRDITLIGVILIINELNRFCISRLIPPSIEALAIPQNMKLMNSPNIDCIRNKIGQSMIPDIMIPIDTPMIIETSNSAIKNGICF
jgi:hypothetical protein